ncbi:hypothetical protein GCM10011316_39810 [Roseibium aquae]|uniref:Mutator family transposase n=1 Tax=Roseibium aquae TaxID=1323746 RepID=A0A916TNR3_9HYPH|nr:hypothetical protein GCM10011316_39810 [Roseibium aquae]
MDINEALWGTRVSLGTVSNLNKKIYAKIDEWRHRPIEADHTYVFVDCIVIRDIRRRTRVVGAFPDEQSCLSLAAAELRHIAAGKWSARKYMNMAPLYQEQHQTHGAVA